MLKKICKIKRNYSAAMLLFQKRTFSVRKKKKYNLKTTFYENYSIFPHIFQNYAKLVTLKSKNKINYKISL